MIRLKELVDRFDTPGKPCEKLSASEFHEVRDGVIELLKNNKKSENHIKEFRNVVLNFINYKDTKESLNDAKEFTSSQLEKDMDHTSKTAHLLMKDFIDILLDTIEYGRLNMKLILGDSDIDRLKQLLCCHLEENALNKHEGFTIVFHEKGLEESKTRHDRALVGTASMMIEDIFEKLAAQIT
jgi:hypothetical protein